MLLNLMSTDLVYPNINVVFDDSIYAVDDDKEFICNVSNRFNSNITFPSYAESIKIGGNPTNYNQPLNIPDSVTNLSSCFWGCTNYNHPVELSHNVTNISQMFYNCQKFNQPMNIPNSVISMNAAFAMPVGGIFNSEVTIEDGVENCAGIFHSCKSLNRVTNFPNTVKNLSFAYYSAVNFNQPVDIPNSVVNCSNMFTAITNYNQPVTIPDGVLDCAYMFSQGQNYNTDVIIPQSVTNTCGMFLQCFNFAAKVYFYMNHVSNAWYMFNFCNNVHDIYLYGIQNATQATRMIRNNGYSKLNIHTDENGKELLRITYLLANGALPTWTNDATNNCIYNTTTNIYIYNTWDGTIPS